MRVKAEAVAFARCRPGISGTDIAPIGLEVSSFLGVGHVRRDYFAKHLIAEREVAQMKHHLDALVNIPMHPVGAA